MRTSDSFKYTSIFLLTMACIVFSIKILLVNIQFSHLLPQKVFDVRMIYSYKTLKDNVVVRSFVPSTNNHQEIYNENNYAPNHLLRIVDDSVGRRVNWTSQTTNYTRQKLEYAFKYRGRTVQYNLNKDLTQPQAYPIYVQGYLEPTDMIQSEDLAIYRVVEDLEVSNLSLTEANYFIL